MTPTAPSICPTALIISQFIAVYSSGDSTNPNAEGPTEKPVREGFEPSVAFGLRRFSKALLSTTQPPHQKQSENIAANSGFPIRNLHLSTRTSSRACDFIGVANRRLLIEMIGHDQRRRSAPARFAERRLAERTNCSAFRGAGLF